jgi:hypothetical protein
MISGKPVPVSRNARPAVVVVLCALSAAFTLYLFVRPPGMDALDRARFGDTIYGRAHRPFVGRVLVPWVVRGIAAVTPEPVRRATSAAIRDRLVRHGEPRSIDEYPYEFAAVVALLFLCLCGFAFCLRRLAVTTLRIDGWRADLVPIAALLLLPCMYVYMSFVYDFATLFLFTLGLVMLAEKRWVPFFVVFAVGTVNKESTILLTLVWLIHFRRSLSTRQLLLGAAAQVLVWLAIRGGISLAYAHNPGFPLEWHLPRNIHRFTHLGFYVMTRGPVSLLREFGPRALAVAGLVGIVLSRRSAPRFLKDAFWIIAPMLLVCALFGFLEEARDYYEFYPVGMLLLAHVLFRRAEPGVPSPTPRPLGSPPPAH